MAATGYRTITIKGGNVRGERLAGESGITPGHLLAVSSGKVIKHATADGATLKWVAVESPHASSGTAENIAITYANGDTVYFAEGQPGDEFYMFLANGSNAVEGVSLLFSSGDGTLKVVSNSASVVEGSLVGFPMESINNNSGGAVRLKVRIA